MSNSNRNLPVKARNTLDGWVSTGIDYSDYRSMSLTKSKRAAERRLPTPIWAINDPMFRRLIVKFMEERAGFRKKQKGGLRERLNRAQASITAQRPRLIDLLDKLCAAYVAVKNYGAFTNKTVEEINALAAKIAGGGTPSMYEEHNREIVDSKRTRDLEIEIRN